MESPDRPNSDRIIIEPRSSWGLLEWSELVRYRDVFIMLAWRDVSVRYKQTALGLAWAVLRPLLLMVVFTVFLAPAVSDGETATPYPLYAYAGLLLWTMFSSAITAASESVVGAERLITKVYFPRLFIPAAAAVPALIDFLVGSILLVGLMLWYRVPVGTSVLLSPLVAVATYLLAVAAGSVLAAINVYYRDVRYIVPFFVQAGLFATPAIYLPAAVDHGGLRSWAEIANPMNGLVRSFRGSLISLSDGPSSSELAVAVAAVAVACPAGLVVFRRLEDQFSDLI